MNRLFAAIYFYGYRFYRYFSNSVEVLFAANNRVLAAR